MYVEQTPQGFNIIDIPDWFMPALSYALESQSAPNLHNDLSQDQKRILRTLSRLITQECEMLE
jgi:hypothetical protein